MNTGKPRFKKTVVVRSVVAALCGTASMMVSQETLAQSASSLQRVEITGRAHYLFYVVPVDHLDQPGDVVGVGVGQHDQVDIPVPEG